MICPICFGRKYDFKKDGNSGYFVECKKCHGTGIVELMTNEEWFCNLDTEDKAREISDMTAQGYWSEELVEKWLKEIHE